MNDELKIDSVDAGDDTSSAQEMMDSPESSLDIGCERVTNESELEVIKVGETADETARELYVYEVSNPQLSTTPFIVAVDNDGDEDDGIILTATAEQRVSPEFDPEESQEQLLGVLEKALKPIMSQEEDVLESQEDSVLDQAKTSMDNVSDTATIPSADNFRSVDMDKTLESQGQKIRVDLPENLLDTVLDSILDRDVNYEHTSSGDSIMVNAEDASRVRDIIKKASETGEIIQESGYEEFYCYESKSNQINAISKIDLIELFKKDPSIRVTPLIESMSDQEIISRLITEDEDEKDLTEPHTIPAVTDDVEEVDIDETPILNDEDTEEIEVDIEDEEELLITKNEDGSIHIKGDVFGLLVAMTDETTAKDIMKDMKTSTLNDESPEIRTTVESQYNRLLGLVRSYESETGASLVDVEMIAPEFNETPNVNGDAFGSRILPPENIIGGQDGAPSTQVTRTQPRTVELEMKESGNMDELGSSVETISPDFTDVDITGKAYEKRDMEMENVISGENGAPPSERKIPSKSSKKSK
ncbi:MAG: hypothetical protein E6R13_02335 [Spirochaetes bacterium]|nr:MAG: hypothetical protein E6R13_02335 [Spirochaetota bacterium]